MSSLEDARKMVEVLCEQVATLKEQNRILQEENKRLEARIAAMLEAGKLGREVIA